MARDDRSSLRGIELLEGLDEAMLVALEKQCIWTKYTTNQMILDSGGKDSHDVYFVVEGAVRIVNFSPSGREIAFANIRMGNYFGELAALSDNPRSASVVAIADCRLAAIRPQVFRRLVQDRPEIGIKVISRLADIVLRCDQRIMDLSTLSAVQRVHVELMRRAKPTEDGEGWQIKPMPKHSDIASRASTSRETVVRALNQLSVGMLVERVGNALVIHDYDRLAALAEGGAPQMIALR